MTKDKSINNTYSFNESILEIRGKFCLKEVNDLLFIIENKLADYSYSSLVIDIDGITQIDSTGITSLYYLKDKCESMEIDVVIKGGDKPVRQKLEMFMPGDSQALSGRKKQNFFEYIGNGAKYIFKEYLRGFSQLAADITYWSAFDLFRKANRRKGEFVNQAVLIGVNAVLIVGAMSFIIGLVLALQSAAQLRSFGANIYIVDLTVIAMMSEMGPLITAIMVAGRSGSSIAAEIATMKVTNETDALRTMGMNPVRFIVVPKMHGALVTMPFLTIIADVFGIAGGMVIALTALDISPIVFIHRMQEAFYMKDVLFGVIKSLVFAYLIVLTGTYFGFRVSKGAEGVGKVTTVAVVVAISLVIVADSIMGLIFY